jgi:serine/threonine protein kinase
LAIEVSGQLRELLTNLVTSFHAQNFVHRDIRDSSLLVRMDGKLETKLIDFDWGGRAKYSIRFSSTTGLFIAHPITTEHGLLMVKDITSLRVDLARSQIRVSNLSRFSETFNKYLQLNFTNRATAIYYLVSEIGESPSTWAL